MPLKPKFCSQCATAVEMHTIEGRRRLVCPACATIFYENPLPVAAALVLNKRREVLLVRRGREPKKGEWCLPMGFAELGESVATAAQRELREEAGIDGRPLRLIDADSFGSEHYGDLLIVTFELEKVGGQEQAGDDATEVRYFPIGRHPPLAFSSNEKALQICAVVHREDWAIQDSFLTLQSGQDRVMLSDVLVELIAQHAGDIARLWLEDVRSNPTTPSYQRVPAEELLERGTHAIAQFGHWLAGAAPPDEVNAFYETLAAERRWQGCGAPEVLSSLMLLKKHLWAFARSQGMWERPIDVYRVLELNRRVAAFFDKVIHHTMRAYGGDEAAESARDHT